MLNLLVKCKKSCSVHLNSLIGNRLPPTCLGTGIGLNLNKVDLRQKTITTILIIIYRLNKTPGSTVIPRLQQKEFYIWINILNVKGQYINFAERTDIELNINTKYYSYHKVHFYSDLFINTLNLT